MTDADGLTWDHVLVLALATRRGMTYREIAGLTGRAHRETARLLRDALVRIRPLIPDGEKAVGSTRPSS